MKIGKEDPERGMFLRFNDDHHDMAIFKTGPGRGSTEEEPTAELDDPLMHGRRARRAREATPRAPRAPCSRAGGRPALSGWGPDAGRCSRRPRALIAARRATAGRFRRGRTAREKARRAPP